MNAKLKSESEQQRIFEWTFHQDVQFVTESCKPVWEALRGARIFITGGTGFIGKWLLETLRHADEQFGLNVKATVLTRDPEKFAAEFPHLGGCQTFQFLQGDIREFQTPQGSFSHLIHGATDASAYLNEHDPRRMFDTVIEGTRRVLDLAVEKSIGRVLFMSSGAVYGQQPWEMERVSEDWFGAPRCLDPRAAYAESKRAAEMLCAIYGKQFGVNVSIARIFALIGPHLNLDIHFAAGNFIRDAMQGKCVVVNGNGLPCRSYLYASDLTIWLWHMLIKAEPGVAYNVGSDESVSIAELAQRVASELAAGEFKVLGSVDTGWNPGRYVPDTNRIQQDLGLYRTVSLEQAIRQTAIWNGWKES